MKHTWKKTLTLLSISQAFSQSVSIFILTISAVIGVLLTGNERFATIPVAAIFSGTMIGIFPLAKLMALKGRRHGFRIAIGLGALGTAISIFGLFTESFWIFAIGHLFIGMQQGGFQFLRFAASEMVPREQKSKGISLVLAGGIVAAFLGPWMAHFSRTYGMSEVLYYAYVPILLMYTILSVLFWIVPELESLSPDNDIKSNEIKARPLRAIFFRLPFLQALVGSAVSFALMILLMTATPLAMSRVGFKSADTSLVIQWHVLGMYIPSFFTGSLIKFLGHKKVILLGVLAIFAEICIVFITQNFLSFLMSLTLLGIGWNFIYISSTSRLTQCYKSSEKEKAQAVHDMVVFSFSTLATFLAGPLLKNLGWVNMHLYALAVLMMTAVFILFRFNKVESRNELKNT